MIQNDHESGNQDVINNGGDRIGNCDSADDDSVSTGNATATDDDSDDYGDSVDYGAMMTLTMEIVPLW